MQMKCIIISLFMSAGLFAAENWQLPVGNLQIELSALEERFTNQEIIMEDLRRLLEKGLESGKEQTKQGVQFYDSRMKKMEGELLQTQTTLIEAAKAINQYKERIALLEKAIDRQNLNIEALKESLQIALEGQINQVAGKREEGQHIVKAGETLEKIAKKYQISLQNLKDLNNLSQDKIFAGQKLRVPEKN